MKNIVTNNLAHISNTLTNSGTVDYRTAPLFRRFGALVIDALLSVPVMLVLNRALGDNSVPLLFIYSAVYTIGFNALKSATPGKLMFRLYVGDSDGWPIHLDKVTVFKTAALRYLGEGALFQIAALINPSLAWLATLIPLVSLVMVLLDPKRRALHDRLAGTQVFMRLRSPSVETPARPFTAELGSGIEARLKELGRLRQEGLLTQDEYDEKRAGILAEL